MMNEQVCCERGNDVHLESQQPRLLPVHINTLGYLLALVTWCYILNYSVQVFGLSSESFLGRVLIGFWFIVGFVLFLAETMSLFLNFGVWVQNTVIGRRLYRFRDSLGGIHLHKALPQYWLRHDGDMTELIRGSYRAHLDPVDCFYAIGPILQVRQGGIFRKNRILGYPWRDLWKIKSCWDGQTIVLEDRHRMYFGGPGMSKEELFSTLERHMDVRQIVEGYDQFGQDVCVVLDRIQKHDSTMGNSPHVRAIRRFLSQSLDSLPEVLSKSWQRYVANSEMLVRRRWDELSAKSEREDSSKDNSAIS